MRHFYIEINDKDLQDAELFLKITYLDNSMTPMVKFVLKEVKTHPACDFTKNEVHHSILDSFLCTCRRKHLIGTN